MLDEGMLIETRFGTYTLIGYKSVGELNKRAKLLYLTDVASNKCLTNNKDILAMQYFWYIGEFYGTVSNDVTKLIQSVDIVRIPVSDIDKDTKFFPASKERKAWILKSKLVNAKLKEFKSVQVSDSIIDGIKFFRKFYLDVIIENCLDVKKLRPYHIYYRVNDAFYLYLGNNKYMYLDYDKIKTHNTFYLIDRLISNVWTHQFNKNDLKLKELNWDCSFLLTL